MHHDVITGTERQAVADDYAFRLHRGSARCSVINEGLKQVLSVVREALWAPSSQPGLRFHEARPRHTLPHRGLTLCSALS